MWGRIKALGTGVKALFTARNIHVSQWFKGLLAGWSVPEYETMAKKAHTNPYASRAIRIVSQHMASLILWCYNGDEKIDDEDHPLLKVLRRPNRRQSWRNFVEAIVNHLYFSGEIFIERMAPVTGVNKNRARSLRLHRPDRFVDFIRKGESEGRGYNEPAGFMERISDEVYSDLMPGEIMGYILTDEHSGQRKWFTIEQMHHVRTYNPTNEDRGLPMLLGAFKDIQMMESAADWNKSISKGGGSIPMYWKPTGLEPGEQLSPEEVASAEESLDRRAQERKSSNKGMVLSGSFDPVNNTITPKDAEWIEGDRNSARKISAVSGVSTMLMNDHKSGSLTDAGVNSEIRALMLLQVLPMTDFLLDELNVWLSAPFGCTLGYDTAEIDALREDENELYRRINMAVGGPWMERDWGRRMVGADELGGEYALPQTHIGMRPINQDQPEQDVNKILGAIGAAA